MSASPGGSGTAHPAEVGCSLLFRASWRLCPKSGPHVPGSRGCHPQRVLSVPSRTGAGTQASWSLVSSRAEGACPVTGPIRTLFTAFHKTVRPRWRGEERPVQRAGPYQGRREQRRPRLWPWPPEWVLTCCVAGRGEEGWNPLSRACGALTPRQLPTTVWPRAVSWALAGRRASGHAGVPEGRTCARTACAVMSLGSPRADASCPGPGGRRGAAGLVGSRLPDCPSCRHAYSCAFHHPALVFPLWTRHFFFFLNLVKT